MSPSATLVSHPRARYDFEILETLTAGVSLLGTEVASLKKSQGKLVGSYVKLIKGVPMLLGAHIPPFQVANAPKDYSPTRDRALLLNKKKVTKPARELPEKTSRSSRSVSSVAARTSNKKSPSPKAKRNSTNAKP